MAIISYDKDEVIAYIPTFNGNDKDDNPLIVNLRYIGYGKSLKYEKDTTIRYIARSKGKDASEHTGIMTEVMSDIQEKQILDNIDSVENYFILRKGEKVEITDAKTFKSTAPKELISEIALAMQDFNKLSRKQVKN
jgi:hypothetical protein